jgi:hypothetical protein
LERTLKLVEESSRLRDVDWNYNSRMNT